MLDFSRPDKTRSEDIGEAITALLDNAIVAHQKAEYEAGRGSGTGDVAKHRIGAGYIGMECDRALAYKYHKAEVEERPSTVSKGELTRHGLAGFWTEDSVADWLALAGFDIRTEKADGDQYGYKVAKDPVTGQFRIAGEIDGVILSGPADMPYPVLWESKKATHKKYLNFKKNGVAKADCKYHGQLQTNMAYLDVKATLFSMLDLDTMKFHFELVEFDAAEAQRLTDRALRVLDSREPEQLPRIARDRSDFRCKFCDYSVRCWSAADPDAAPVTKPAWMTGGGDV